MRIAGTVPSEIGKWAEQKIAEREYHNWSHLLESALLSLREAEPGKRKSAGEAKGGGGR